MWYSFVAASATPTITVVQTSGVAGLRRSQLFSGTCASLTSLACSGNADKLVAVGLTPDKLIMFVFIPAELLSISISVSPIPTMFAQALLR